ncbi:MAG TPA: cbb3-type cytochrome c oxidase subunit I [Candidatus Saccharimonadales bacterium]|nr:cbb3-type cytochrome c oxidase subunit I [Candidatus Saccharimonadales bacterium]
MENMSSLIGRLSTHAFPTNPITAGAAVGMIVLIVLVLGLITLTGKWQWLWRDWLTTTNHKRIGVMYILVALLMLLRGASDAGMMRLQQATSAGQSHGFMSASMFQQVASAHGTIMIFFAGMGLMFGLINLVLPLQIGARDVAFPFMNATSFWLFAAGALLINLSLVLGDFSAAGWLAYPPLSEIKYSPGTGVDYWIWSLQIAGIGSLMSGINFITTILKERAPGMDLMKMPMFAWSVLGAMTLVAFAFPILTVTLTLLALDRTVGMHFFTAGQGGNAMMYVNLIWAWGHPEVYILVLPAFGIFSEIVSTFSGKSLFGYRSMVWAIWAIVFFSYTVWLHHFFTMGAGADVNAVFGIATMIIAIPTGVKIFNWLFTMYRGRIRFASPMIWFLGFVFLFTMGGVAGVMMAVPAIDFQVHNSLFLVAHFHTMIVSGVLFGYFAGLTYWFPKFFGFRLNEKLGKYAAYCWIGGFVLAFGPLYILGLMGATRRLDHYSSSLGWQPLFIVAGIGAFIIFVGILLQILQVAVSVFKRSETRDITGDPWNGRTLEWSVSSPPPSYNFAVIPNVESKDAFWALKHAKTLDHASQIEDIALPKNTPAGLYIATGAFFFGFAFIWHIWWLCGLSFIGIVLAIIIKTTGDTQEEIITASTLESLEASAANWRSF